MSHKKLRAIFSLHKRTREIFFLGKIAMLFFFSHHQRRETE